MDKNEKETKVESGLKLDEDTLMVLSVLKGAEGIDAATVLSLLPKAKVKAILDNKKDINEMLNDHKKADIEVKNEIDLIKAKAKMKINMYSNFH